MKIRQKTTGNESIDFHQDAPYPQTIAKALTDDVIFTFPDGVPAFEDSKRFVIVLNDNIRPFVYLKSLDIEGLGFICIDPFTVKSNYVVNLPGKDMSLLGLKEPENALVFTTVTVDKDPRNTTTNLLAPIVINMENSVGRQIVLDEHKYPVKFKIWEELEKSHESNTKESV